MRVLLIEDDRKLARLIQKMLETENMSVDVAHDGDTGVDLALRGTYEVAIVDWMLPGRDGLAVCEALRSARLTLGILMLTARTQVEDRVAGLYHGADDYLGKPFAFDELIARVYALARRVNQASASAQELRVGSLVMDLKSHTARRGEQPLDLSKTEWNLLEYFMRHPGQVLTRQNILDYVWSYDSQVQATMVDVYVSYLRGKVNQAGRKDPIQTKRGVGYFLKADDA
ncbi:MAG: response regulator transcription factor [Anaerolineaceae bacterium]|nr:response regulator transcription factor [Anaerolineaceae bacterium]